MVNPFVVNAQVQGELYRDASRLRNRIGALLQAKVEGGDPIGRAVAVAARYVGAGPRVLDVGCGLGGGTDRMCAVLHPSLALALDTSTAMLRATARRSTSTPVRCVCADFHQIPLNTAAVDCALVAFCLYHSATPAAACQEVARCLAPRGIAMILTKSADSYRDVDRFVAQCGLDSDACSRESLYASFHSANAEAAVAESMRVLGAEHERHRFHFSTPELLARYVTTSPKYRAVDTRIDGDTVLARFRACWPTHGVSAESEILLITAAR
jgi:SAM-dependent methyltransferase